jgi:hypothetical protein
MSPNRIVAIYTPLVFAPIAGCVAVWLADKFPGVNLARSDLAPVFIAGMLIALVMAAQWVHGWQKWEAREAERQDLALRLATAEEPRPPAPAIAVGADDDLFDDDLEDEFDELDELDDFDPVTPALDVGDRPPN